MRKFSPRDDVEDLRRQVRFQGTGRLYHAIGSSRINASAGRAWMVRWSLKGRVASFTMVDHDPKTDMSAMMRTTAFPASIVVQMLASGAISKRGGVLQEIDVPAGLFLDEIEKRGIKIEFAME